MYRYNITALFEKLTEADALVRFLSDLADFRSLRSHSAGFAEMLSGSSAGIEAKYGLVDAAVDSGSPLSPFLKRLVANGDASRFELLSTKIFEYAERLAGIPYAEIQSAEPLAAEHLDRIRASLAKLSGNGTPVVSVILRKDLMAGFAIRLRGRTYDFSVRGSLDRLKAGLRAVSD